MTSFPLALALAVGLGGAVAAPNPASPDTAASRAAHGRALELLARQDLSGALREFRRSIQADPDWLPAQMELVDWEVLVLGVRGARRPDAPHPSGVSPIPRCIARASAEPRGHWLRAVPPLLDLERREGRTACTAYYIAALGETMASADGWHDVIEEARADAVRLLEGEWPAWRVATAGEIGRNQAEAVGAAMARARHPVHRVQILASRVSILDERGDRGRALELARNLEAALRRDDRAGLEALFIVGSLATVSGLANTARGPRERLLRIASASPDPLWRWWMYESIGRDAIDRLGEPATAYELYDRMVLLADSIPDYPNLRARARLLRGRALSKLGRLEGAETDLVEAAGLAATLGEPYWEAEAWHNLAHVHEARGDFIAASRAADLFMRRTDDMMGIPIRIMSRRDAAIIRWKAGWHASADSAFLAMVDAVEEHDSNHYWAGEFFERKGRLDLALRYYRRGLETYYEPGNNLQGLVRVHRALGNVDSATSIAGIHDADTRTWTGRPLLPEVLLEAGHLDEALDVARRWAASRAENRNVEGAAIALATLADLELRAGQPAAAARSARAALALADSFNLTELRIDGRRLYGSARLREGGPDAIASLRSAVALARAHPTIDRVHATEAALAAALAATGRDAEAMEHYDRAARAVEEVTRGMELDVSRSLYLQQHIAPFDGALGLVLRGGAYAGGTADPDAALGWAQRRIAAALVLAGAEAVGEPAVAPMTADEIRARLRPDEGLVLWLTLDGTVAAVVVTHRTTAVRTLTVRADSLRARIDRLRRPFTQTWAGRLDLARARFDARLAADLHRSLLAPLAADLEGVSSLLVVPDGPLHLLPFELLVTRYPSDSDAGAQRYVLDEWDVAYLPSPRFLARRPVVTTPDDRLLVVGYGAPGAHREAEGIRRAWPGPMTLLEGASAGESAVGAEFGRHDVLHFATHATSDASDPLASHLALAPDEAADGLLHLSEIREARPAGKLVVLGACETLPGPLLAGEGPMGLARAFLSGGAAAVVASHWPVGATTADLMAAFYEGVVAGEEPGRALGAAKRRVRADPATAHPFHWAGFVLVRGSAAGRPTRAGGRAAVGDGS